MKRLSLVILAAVAFLMCLPATAAQAKSGWMAGNGVTIHWNDARWYMPPPDASWADCTYVSLRYTTKYPMQGFDVHLSDEWGFIASGTVADDEAAKSGFIRVPLCKDDIDETDKKIVATIEIYDHRTEQGFIGNQTVTLKPARK